MKKTILSIVLMQFVLATTLSAQRSNPLKIVNWNVLYSFNHKKSTKLGIDWLKKQNADIVGLQELNKNSPESLQAMATQWGHAHSVILKQHGFPVGLTSKQPIEVIERRVKGFHHGYLHCKTYDINFFIVHFWPKKDHEAKAIIEKIKPLLASGEKVIVMGDFNTYSRKDKAFLAGQKNKKPLYEVVDMFEEVGFVDLVYKHDKKAKYSCPSPIVIPRWAKDLNEVKKRRERIDFIFADAKLQKSSKHATVITTPEVEKISDHYPVIATFEKLKKQTKK